jgi:hypothetical protein
LPEERPKKTQPARRRPAAAKTVSGEIATTRLTALPPAEKPKRTPRAKKADAVEAAEPKSTTRVARKKPTAAATAAEKPKRAPKAKASEEAAPVKKTASRKKTSTTATARKKK